MRDVHWVGRWVRQGVFLKRHRIPREGGNGYFSMEDLNVAQEVTFYARTFYVVSCDPFTRSFLTNSGIHVPDDEGYPGDPIDQYRATMKKKVRSSRRLELNEGTCRLHVRCGCAPFAGRGSWGDFFAERTTLCSDLVR